MKMRKKLKKRKKEKKGGGGGKRPSTVKWHINSYYHYHRNFIILTQKLPNNNTLQLHEHESNTYKRNNIS